MSAPLERERCSVFLAFLGQRAQGNFPPKYHCTYQPGSNFHLCPYGTSLPLPFPPVFILGLPTVCAKAVQITHGKAKVPRVYSLLAK